MFVQPTQRQRNGLGAAALVLTLVGGLLGPVAPVASAADGPWHNSILWHNSASGESQIWYMDGARVSSRATVLGEDGQPAFVGLPFSIVGVSSDRLDDGTSSIVWHNRDTGETQFWPLFNERVKRRETVLGESGAPAYVGLPWRIVGVGDFYGDWSDDIVWHNSATGETQLWRMSDSWSGSLAKVKGRATVLGENGQPAYVGLPWSIVAVGNFKMGGYDDLVWHNSSTGETQLWLMDGHRVTGRRTVLGESGTPAYIGLPWSIVGANDFDNDGKDDLVWHNSSTGETQLWLMNYHQVKSRATVLGENGQPTFVGAPWSIVGVKHFSRGLTLRDPSEPR